MITHKQGNLLDVTEGVIIHGCNAQGVMGSGVALAIKNKYPKAYDSYKAYEKSPGLILGSLSMCKVTPKLYIVNLVTQESYGRDPSIRYVSYGAIHLGFEKLQEVFSDERVFHFPTIGAGLGNGNWVTISTLIELACPGREMNCWQL